jgi:type I restriction enzyme R subunit
VEQVSEGALTLDEGSGEVKAIYSGKGPQHVPEKENLSKIIEVLNARFGMDLDEKDQLLFDQFEETWATDPEVIAQAQNNEFDNFRLVFDRMFLNRVVERMDDNEEIYRRVLDDEAFQKTLMDLYAERLYHRLRAN